MKIEIVKDEGRIQVKEGQHIIYTIKEEYEQGLRSFYLKNPYGEEVYGMYQIKTSFSMLKRYNGDYTIYLQEEKVGEFHRTKFGYEMRFHDVYYRFYGGLHCNEKTIIVKDKNVEAQMVLNDPPYLKIQNTNHHALFVLLLYILKYYITFDCFDASSYAYNYEGIYNDSYTIKK